MIALSGHSALAVAAPRTVTESEMFGELSSRIVPPASAAVDAVAASAGDPVLQALTVGLFFCVAMMLRNRLGMSVLVQWVSRGRLSDDFESGRRDASISDEYARLAMVTGVVAATVYASKYAGVWLPDSLVPSEGMRVAVAAAIVAASMIGVALYQRAVLTVIAAVGRGREFAELLLTVKRTFFATAAMFMAPVVVLAAMSERSARVWMVILAGECCILAFLFLKETVTLFIRKKIPIFQWFLYLCTVEAFPLTFVCASIARFR